MAVPMFVVNGHDYAKLITELKPSRNDVDSDGSGRNLLDGLMYRSRLEQSASGRSRLAVWMLRP